MNFTQITYVLFTQRQWFEQKINKHVAWKTKKYIFPVGMEDEWEKLPKEEKSEHPFMMNKECEFVTEPLVHATIDSTVNEYQLSDTGVEFTKWAFTFYTSGANAVSFDWMRLGSDGLPVRYNTYASHAYNFPRDMLQVIDIRGLDDKRSQDYLEKRLQRERRRFDSPLYDDGTREKVWKTHKLINGEETDYHLYSLWHDTEEEGFGIRFRDPVLTEERGEPHDARDLFF